MSVTSAPVSTFPLCELSQLGIHCDIRQTSVSVVADAARQYSIVVRLSGSSLVQVCKIRVVDAGHWNGHWHKVIGELSVSQGPFTHGL